MRDLIDDDLDQVMGGVIDPHPGSDEEELPGVPPFDPHSPFPDFDPRVW